MIEINLAEAKRLIAELVEEYGDDYVYPYQSCVNAIKGGESIHLTLPDEETGSLREHFAVDTALCIVGKAMVKAGVPAEALTSMPGGFASYKTLSGLRDKDYIKYSEAAAAYLRHAQYMQDSMESWGDAKRYADELSSNNDYSDDIN
jgi:hypothetical protein